MLLGVVPVLQAEAAGRVASGSLLGGYEATRFKSKPKPVTPLENIEILVQQGDNSAQKHVDRAVAMAKGALLTRYAGYIMHSKVKPLRPQRIRRYLYRKGVIQA